MPTQTISLKEAVTYGMQHLKQNRFEAEILLCHVLKIPRSYLYSHLDEAITDAKWINYQDAIARRVQGVPIAYITGLQEFWSLELEVSEYTLIPRPETELLVQLTLEKLAQKESASVADLGVGSGAVAIALASERSSWEIIGADISEETLKIAMNNVRKHNIKNITLMVSDWFAKFTDQKFDAIVSNPPYVAEEDPHLTQLSFEPLGALVSGKDGLDAIRQIIVNSHCYLKDQGWLLLEHGYDQAAQVRVLLDDAGYEEVASAKDINNIERITYGQMKGKKNAGSISK